MASVRVFGYRSIVQLQQSGLKHFNSDSVFCREEPYLWSSGPLALSGAAVATAVQPNDEARFVVVEVDDGAQARYEVNLQGPNASTARVASANSPKVSGENIFEWVKGATMSFIDAAGT